MSLGVWDSLQNERRKEKRKKEREEETEKGRKEKRKKHGAGVVIHTFSPSTWVTGADRALQV